jgi:acyl-CoA reductase-like NAD-dependent aldehyde dehydrogenase
MTDLQASPATRSPAALPGLSPVLGLPGSDDYYARNLIGGSWQFPAAPFDVEIRSPRDSAVIATVPLSSRFDVARAVAAARAAAPQWAADWPLRRRLMAKLVNELRRSAGALARLQARETGMALADSRAIVEAVARLAGMLTVCSSDQDAIPAGGVTGHVLSWGAPAAEMACAVLPQLSAGRTAVVKPSLRAPLSAAAIAYLATRLGFPPGVLNIVQGAGADVGAAIAGSAGLAALHVRAGDRTLAQAGRSARVTGARLHPLQAGGNLVVAGRAADPDLVAAAVVEALRLHSAGGPLSLPLLAAQAEVAGHVVDAVLARLPGCQPAPLPAERLRNRALAQIAAVAAEGARVLRGGAVPDDAAHRMGWLLPPTVITAGAMNGGPGSASRATAAGEPAGPVLTVVTWRTTGELAGTMPHARYADGLACVWGLDEAELAAAQLPHPVVLPQAGPMAALHGGLLPAAWTGGYAARRNAGDPGR